MSVTSLCVVASRKPINGISSQISGRLLSSRLLDCIKRADIAAGRCVHDYVLRDTTEFNSSVGIHFIRLYASFGYLYDANRVFDRISKPNVYAWSAIISAHAKHGQSAHAIKLYYKMQESHVELDNHVLVAALKASTNMSALKDGMLMHHHVIEILSDMNTYVASSLIDAYAKGGALEDAYRVFNRLQNPDKVTWGIMIGAYAQHGHGVQALRLYTEMQLEGTELDEVIFLGALKACCSIVDSEQIRMLHTHMITCGIEADKSLGNALVDAYAKCGSLKEARRVFMMLPKRDVVTWGAIIEGCVQHEDGEDALQFFCEMQRENIESDPIIAMSLLKACSKASNLYHGKLVHCYILINKFESNLQVSCSIVDMYAKCGSLNDAHASFCIIPHHNVVTLNTMISACIQHGHMQEAACFFQQMAEQNMIPNQVSFVCILKLCSGLLDLCLGRIAHAYFIESGFELGGWVINTLTDMYAKCGSLADAHHMFERSSKQDVVTWGVLILGFVQHGHYEEGCKRFWHMLAEGLKADEAAFLGGLKACSGIGDLCLGKLIHSHLIERDCDLHTSIGNTLLDFYGKCGSFKDALAVFEALKKRDEITYNAIIAACAHYSQSQESLQLFQQMIQSGISPTKVTFACTLSACTNIVALDYGKLIHNHIVEMDVEEDIYIINALIDMYWKCGSPESACKVFDNSSNRDVVTWNALIAGCTQYSSYEQVTFYFEKMCRAGVKPDGVTFLCLLSACSHAGSVDEGRHLFTSMKRDYGLTPTADHYSCLLDLLGRAGRLVDAADFLDCTPGETTLEGQTSLLSHCKENGNIELGHQCFDQFIKFDNSNAPGYVLMSHACSHVGVQIDISSTDESRRDAYA